MREFPRFLRVATCPQCGLPVGTPRHTAVDRRGRPREGSFGSGVPATGLRLGPRWRRYRTERGANKAVCVHPFHQEARV